MLDGFRGPVKVQLCGPWTLAATLELPRTMNVAIADPGAVADLTASLAEGAAAFAADVAKRVPGARLVVQFDEPALPAVAEGMVPTASGLSRLAAVEADPLRERLEQVLASTHAYTVVHCCARLGSVRDNQGGGGRWRRLRPRPATAGGRGRGGRVRGGRHGTADGRGPGGAGPGAPEASAPAGRRGWPDQQAGRAGGSNPADGSSEARETAERVIRLWRRLGLSLATCAEQAVITPACGLAGASPAQARAALTRCREAASMLPELIEETGGES